MKLFLPFSFAAVTAVSARAVSQAFEEELKLTPVQRVTKLLKEMQSQLAADSAKDEEMAGKLACWCKTRGLRRDSARSKNTGGGRRGVKADVALKAGSLGAGVTSHPCSKYHQIGIAAPRTN